jgi:hypothetical protein
MQPDNISHIPVFFIIGRARSGTTLLRSLLDNHPNVIIPPGECPFVSNLFSRYFKKNLELQKMRGKFFNDLRSQPAFGYMNPDIDKLKNEILSNHALSYHSLCKQVYMNYRPVSAKKDILAIGDKNPDYSLFIPRLIRIFPETKFIHIIRDPRSNVLSMMNARYESPVIASLAYRWKYYNREIEKQKITFPERILTVKYEEFVAEPERTLKEICSFLKLKFHQSMFDFYKHKEELLKIYPAEAIEKYHKSLFKPVNDSGAEVWKEGLSQRKIKTIEIVCGRFAEKYGYLCQYSKFTLISCIGVLPGIFYGWLYMVWGEFISALPYSIRMLVIKMMAAIFKPWWKRYPMGKKV